MVGNEDNIFQIDENTGNITMLKPADIAGPISLTVLVNGYYYYYFAFTNRNCYLEHICHH